MSELSKSEKGDEVDGVKLLDLLHGKYFKGAFVVQRVHIADSTFSWNFDVIALFLAVVFIGSVLYAFQQLSGINAVFYFSSTVFKSAGVPSDIGNIWVGIVNILGNGVAARNL